jgi:hypothetical protein
MKGSIRSLLNNSLFQEEPHSRLPSLLSSRPEPLRSACRLWQSPYPSLLHHFQSRAISQPNIVFCHWHPDIHTFSSMVTFRHGNSELRSVIDWKRFFDISFSLRIPRRRRGNRTLAQPPCVHLNRSVGINHLPTFHLTVDLKFLQTNRQSS